MIIRATVANISAREFASALGAAGLDGTTWDTFGATRQWGGEPGATAETVVDTWDDVNPFRVFLRNLLATRGEQAAYVTVDGRQAFLVYANGHAESLAA